MCSCDFSCAQKGLDALKNAPLMVQHSQIKGDAAAKASQPLPGFPRASDGPVEASAVFLWDLQS